MTTETYVASSIVPAAPQTVWDWHSRPGAFERLVPPWQHAEILDPGRGVEEGSRTLLRIGKSGLGFKWLAEHRNVNPPHGFDDVQLRGPFRSWEHKHRFEDAHGGSTLRDEIHYAPPLGALGRFFAGGFLRSDIERTFRYRHRVTAADLLLHARFADRPRLRVGITGASGLVGRALTAVLTTGGHDVVRLVRLPAAGEDEATWDPNRGIIDARRVEGLDAMVHLAGENIAGGRWTSRRMRRIRDSRVAGTEHLLASLAGLSHPPSTIVSASAIGIYGNRGGEILDDVSSPGSGFLAQVGADWESAASSGDFRARRVFARFGVILSPRGGALAKMLPAFRLGAGGRLGTGAQFMSWISIDDAVAAIVSVLQDNQLEGPVNVTAPQACSNRNFTAALSRALRRPALVPVPAFAARLALGKMADEALLSSTRVVPKKLLDSGFEFQHPTLDLALAHLLGLDPELAE